MKVTPEIRDTILALTGIVVSICSGLWTFYNYNATQRINEVNAIFAVSSAIQEIEISSKSSEKDKTKISQLIEALYISLPHKYNQISPPYKSGVEWQSHWQSLNNNVGIAYTQGFDQAEREIKLDWNAIMKMKGLKVLRE